MSTRARTKAEAALPLDPEVLAAIAEALAPHVLPAWRADFAGPDGQPALPPCFADRLQKAVARYERTPMFRGAAGLLVTLKDISEDVSGRTACVTLPRPSHYVREVRATEPFVDLVSAVLMHVDPFSPLGDGDAGALGEALVAAMCLGRGVDLGEEFPGEGPRR